MPQARQIVGPDRLIGVSTHSIEQARQAVLSGADYLGVGPTFPSQTKQFESFAGLEFVRAVSDEIGLPWFAIGGISAENVAQVVEAGATRVAVSSAVCAADDPSAVARELCDLTPQGSHNTAQGREQSERTLGASHSHSPPTLKGLHSHSRVARPSRSDGRGRCATCTFSDDRWLIRQARRASPAATPRH